MARRSFLSVFFKHESLIFRKADIDTSYYTAVITHGAQWARAGLAALSGRVLVRRREGALRFLRAPPVPPTAGLHFVAHGQLRGEARHHRGIGQRQAAPRKVPCVSEEVVGVVAAHACEAALQQQRRDGGYGWSVIGSCKLQPVITL